LARGTGANSSPLPGSIEKENNVKKLRLDHREFNDLPLWRQCRDRELHSLSLPARRIANRYGIDATTARLLALLAGLGDGRSR
jgi:hypothetical protein